MKKKVIILDLDNTIYPVTSIGDKLFAPLFRLIEEDENLQPDMDKIRRDIMRKPFQYVAADYNFSKELMEKGVELLKETTYDERITPFPDYEAIKSLPLDKFLVTTGFLKMQQSKVKAMNLEKDFKEIFIIDPMSTDEKKKDVFIKIMQQHHYKKDEMLIVGDDADSEIKAARELNIDSVLIDKLHRYDNRKNIASFVTSDLEELVKLLRY